MADDDPSDVDVCAFPLAVDVVKVDVTEDVWDCDVIVDDVVWHCDVKVDVVCEPSFFDDDESVFWLPPSSSQLRFWEPEAVALECSGAENQVK